MVSRIVPANVINTNSRVSPALTREEWLAAIFSPQMRNSIQAMDQGERERLIKELLSKAPEVVPLEVYEKAYAENELPVISKAAPEPNTVLAA